MFVYATWETDLVEVMNPGARGCCSIEGLDMLRRAFVRLLVYCMRVGESKRRRAQRRSVE